MSSLAVGIVLGFMFLVGIAAQIRCERALKAAGGLGIVALALAGNQVRADEIVAAWGPAGVAKARRGLYADFVLIIGYSGLLAFLLIASAPRVDGQLWPWLGSASLLLAVLSLLAGAVDAVENFLLLAFMRKTPHTIPVVRWARRCFLAKFSLIALVSSWFVLVTVPVSVLSHD